VAGDYVQLLKEKNLPNTMLWAFQTQQPSLLVSNASVQKNGQSGFAWVITHEHHPLWQDMRLAPGTANHDMYSGRAEAYGLLAAV